MPRIRTIKPEFFTSDTVSVLPLRARLTWIGLWTHCDDYGRCRDNVKLIKASVWPLDDVSIADIEMDLNTLADCRLIERYEVDLKLYLQVTNWGEHQKVSHPSDSKIPSPDFEWDPPSPSGDSPEDSGGSHEGSGDPRPGKEQGKEKEKDALARFADFYAAYPRKKDRRKGELAWRSALKRGADPDRVIQAAVSYAQLCRATDPKYVKYPATWLNAEAYLDEPDQFRLVEAVPDWLPADPLLAFDELRNHGSAQRAAHLIGAVWVEPSQRPSDPTPFREWVHLQRVRLIDAHETEIRAALNRTERNAG